MVQIDRCVKPAFRVIGMEGSTREGAGVVARLWEHATARFAEVAALTKKDEHGNPVGYWGAMSDFSRAFRPWENGFTEGLYLAGVEALDGAEAPAGWTQWQVPGYEYLYMDAQGDAASAFALLKAELDRQGLTLVGAANDFICPQDGHTYVFLPIRRLDEA